MSDIDHVHLPTTTTRNILGLSWGIVLNSNPLVPLDRYDARKHGVSYEVRDWGHRVDLFITPDGEDTAGHMFPTLAAAIEAAAVHSQTT